MKSILLASLLLLAVLALVGCSSGSSSNFEVYLDPDCKQVMDAAHPMQGATSGDGTYQTATVYVKNTSSHDITVKANMNVTKALPGVSIQSDAVTLSPKQAKPITVTLSFNNYFPDEANRISIVFEEVKG